MLLPTSAKNQGIDNWNYVVQRQIALSTRLNEANRFFHPRSVAVNHAGLWIRRRRFESARGYPGYLFFFRGKEAPI